MRVSSGWPSLALPSNRPQVACLQARLVIDNVSDSWLTRLFAIEYATLFDVINPGLAVLDSPVPLGGTSNHFRTSALRNILRVGRLERHRGRGYRHPARPARIPRRGPSLGHLRGGSGTASRVDAPAEPMDEGLYPDLHHPLADARAGLARTRLLAPQRGRHPDVRRPCSSALGYPIFMAICLARIGAGRFISADSHWALVWSAGSLVLFALGLAAMMVPACIGLKRRRLWPLLAWVPLLPIYYLLVSVAAWRAVGQLARNPFHWNKTAHGLGPDVPDRRAQSCFAKSFAASSGARLRLTVAQSCFVKSFAASSGARLRLTVPISRCRPSIR